MESVNQNSNFTEPNSELVGQCHSFLNFSSSSSPSFDDRDDDNDNDDNDEDMANCLILLAQGPPASQSSSSLGKIMEAPEGQNGKATRCRTYECKTCSQTFPSFQALGGHRSSHRSTTMGAAAAANLNPIFGTSSTNEQQRKQLNYNNISSSFDQLHLNRSDCYTKKSKLVNNNKEAHQCSICGAKFMSGQALGGHMRRHRRVCNKDFEEFGGIERRRIKKQRSNLLCLDLDLNLPAYEDDVRDRSGVVLMAAPTLSLGYHY